MSTTAQQTSPIAYAAAFRETMLQAILQEKETTKRVIAAIPDAKRDYRPDPKARTAWELAWHIAQEDACLLLQTAEQKFTLPDPRFDHEKPATAAELAAWYDKKMTAAVEKMRALTPEQLVQPIQFMGFLNWPTFMYLLLVNNHSIHHRGQLCTYLRPMGAQVPSIYGPSADVQMM